MKSNYVTPSIKVRVISDFQLLAASEASTMSKDDIFFDDEEVCGKANEVERTDDKLDGFWD